MALHADTLEAAAGTTKDFDHHPKKHMSHAPPFTKARLRRAIDVAREKGFRVLARPDGTLVFEKDSNPQATEEALEQDKEIVL